MKKRLAIFSTHPIQYYSPLYRELASRLDIDLHVYYSFKNSVVNQAKAGFGVEFEWDIPLLDGYQSTFLNNISPEPSSQHFGGCDTPEVKELIKHSRFDAVMVHGWYTKSYRQTMRACKKSQTPLFVRGDSTLASNYNWFKSVIKKYTHKRLLSVFDCFLIVGERAREYYANYGASNDRMIRSPHFVDNQFFETGAMSLSSNDDLRAKFKIPADSVVFLFCGKFVSIKRPFDFLKAMSILAKQHENVSAIMVGDGPLRKQIEEMIQAENIPVHLAGFFNQSKMPSVYASSDVLVLSSESETWGLVVNEAMACGKSAIVSNTVGCSPDVILQGITGYEFLKGNVEELANSMRHFVYDRKLINILGENARSHIRTFSAKTAADGICEAVHRFGLK